MMRDKRYGGDVRVRSPPPPPSRAKIRECQYSSHPREIQERGSLSRFVPSLGSVSSESERLRRSDYGSVSVERRDYDRHFDDRDRDGQLRTLSQFNEGLSRDSTSMKFQWKHLLAEPTKSDTDMNHSSKHSTDYGVIATRVSTERNYQGSRFPDMGLSGMLLEKPVSVETERAKIYTLYPPDVGVSKSSGHADGSLSLTSQSLNINLHKDEDLLFRDHSHLDKLAAYKPSAREVYKEEENPMLYSKNASDYVMSSSRFKAFVPVSSGILQEDFPVSFEGGLRVPSDGFRLSAGVNTKSIGADAYGKKSCTKSPADPEVRLSDMRNYPRSYLSPSEGKYGDYSYPEVLRRERGDMGTMADEFYGKMGSVQEDTGHRDLFRTSVVDSIVDRIDESSHGEHLREGRLWDHHPSSQGQPIPNYLDASGSLHPRKQDGEVLGYRSTHLEYEREVHQDHGNLHSGEVHGYERDGGPWSYEERSEMLPMTEYEPCVDGINGSPQERLTAGGLDLHEPSRKMLKRERGIDKKLSRNSFGSKFSSNRKTAHRIHVLGDADKQQTGEDMKHLFLSKRLRFPCFHYGKTGMASNEMADHRIPNSDDRLSSDNISVSMPRHLRKPHKSGGGDIKKRLGPGPQNFHVSLPYVKNYKPYKFPKRIRNGFRGSLHVQGEDHLEGNVTPAKTEPPENSEDFKQLVHSAFFKFVKQLNENSAQRTRFMEQGKADSLKCSICGSDSREFGDTESLVMHAYTSPKVGCRSQHLGFYKALCVLMGWRSALAPNSPWVHQILSDAETWAIKEDLIIWPPVVIIHNGSIGNNNPDERVIVSTEVLEATLKDMGFGEKTKVCRGKPANQSIMVVRFNSTFSGLQEAERLHKFYAQTKHGRAEFQQINSSNGCSNFGKIQNVSADKVKNVLYGYLGIAEDLDKLDFETKKRCLVKSKKEIQEIADAPLKTE